MAKANSMNWEQIAVRADKLNGELQAQNTELVAALRTVTDRLSVVIECDNEDSPSGAARADVEAYKRARAVLAKVQP